jgi:hypothetical protein
MDIALEEGLLPQIVNRARILKKQMTGKVSGSSNCSLFLFKYIF